MSVKLKTELTAWVPGKVAALLREASETQGVTVNALVETVLVRWARMVREWGCAPDGWKAVPVTEETQAILAEYVKELGDTETQHLETALVLYFEKAAENRRISGSY